MRRVGKQSIGIGNLTAVADLTREKRYRSTSVWVEQWHNDKEVEVVCLGTQEFGYKGEQKIGQNWLYEKKNKYEKRGNIRTCLYDDGDDSVNSEMWLLKGSMNRSWSKIFDSIRGNGIQSKSGETSLLIGGGAVSSLWRKENLDADAPSWQVLWWEVE